MKKIVASLALGLAGVVAGTVWLSSPSDSARKIPGQGVTASRPGAPAKGPIEASGLKVFYSKYGKYQLSVDAAGSNGASHKITVLKPTADAVVEKAYLMAASINQYVIPNGGITLNGQAVSWFSSAFNTMNGTPSFMNNVLGDVTGIVADKVNPAAPGKLTFTLVEGSTNNIDGETLVVVFKVPSMADKHTVALMFGAQQTAGDRFELSLANPINPKRDGARADMGLGISFGYQPTQASVDSWQYSLITVNGQRISTEAGGQDDGIPLDGVDGALITTGGAGDKRNNPADPFSISGGPLADDEYYNLLPFIKKTDTVIRVDTSNPSGNDNIYFAWFDLSADAEVNKDTDGDGLLDSWEETGLDYNGDGKVDVTLPGANKLHKDIYIAYAWMAKGSGESKSHQPGTDVLDAVTQAFANAPVSNPDGLTGITMHWKKLVAVPHVDNIDVDFVDFDTIMNPLVSVAERKIYHRMLNGHMYGGGTSSGISRGIPASDFVETLGGWSSNPGKFKQRAGTIMHELGHNLGLHHGGIDDVNYKPNHLSIMSYLNQMDWLLKDGKALLDYDRQDLKDLNEFSLSEKAGLDVVGGDDSSIVSYGVRWNSSGTRYQKTTGANKNIDWNQNATIDAGTVAVDINGDSAGSTLRGRFVEWDNIIYDGGDVGASGGAKQKKIPLRPNALVEMNFETYKKMHNIK
jgi:hypothetical protein